MFSFHRKPASDFAVEGNSYAHNAHSSSGEQHLQCTFQNMFMYPEVLSAFLKKARFPDYLEYCNLDMGA